MKGYKYTQILVVTFKKPKSSGGSKAVILKKAYFNSKPKIAINDNDIEENLIRSCEEITNRIDVWISEGSGWTIESVDQHFINFAKYKPLKSNSYVELPKELQHHRKGLINLQHKNNKCFRWCHIRHLNPQDRNSQRTKRCDKEFISKLDYTNVQFPVSVKHYNKVEKQNNINMNVFGYENKTPFPIYISKEKHKNSGAAVLNLLLIKDHYVLIYDFNRFMHNQTKHKAKKHFCMYCLQCFCSENILEKHKKNCLTVNGKQAGSMPNKGEKVQFNNYHKQLEVPFVIYADFEAIVEKIHGVKNNPDNSYTDVYQKHKDCSYAYKLVCCYDDQYSKPLELYRGPDAVYKFIVKLLEEEKWCKKTMKKHFNKLLEITKEETEFKLSDSCHICGIKHKPCDINVRDHCHITGKYRGSAHQKCNMNYKLSEKIPAIFHNLRGYDNHFIMQEIGKFNRKKKCNTK